jgi:putative flippase GtrA
VPSRLPHLFVEIGRFMVTGGLATITSFTIFNFLVHGLYVTKNPWLGDQPSSSPASSAWSSATG